MAQTTTPATTPATTTSPEMEDETESVLAVSAPAEASALPDHIVSDTVLARVGEDEITLGEVIAYRQTLPGNFQDLPDEVLLSSILSQMIDQTLLAHAAEQARLEQGTAFQLALRNQRRAVMADAYLSHRLQEEVTEAALAEAYARKYTDVPAVPEVRSSHILVEDKAKAEEIKAYLDTGTDFAALAAQYSTDATAPRGGDRGWLSYSQMIPGYADAVRSMSTGEVSGPVQTPFGWHLIRVDAKRDRPVPELADVEPMLIKALAEEVAGNALADLRGSSEIERLESDVPPQAIRADDLIQD